MTSDKWSQNDGYSQGREGYSGKKWENWSGKDWSNDKKNNNDWSNDNQNNSEWSRDSWSRDKCSGSKSGWGNENSSGSYNNWSNGKSWSRDDWPNKSNWSSQKGSWSKDYSGKGDYWKESWSGNRGGNWGSRGGNNDRLNLRPVDFRAVKLSEFVKDFYVPPASVKKRPEDEVERLRMQHDISIMSGDDVPKIIASFDEASFPEYITRSLYRQFGRDARPTPIQMQGWPIALSGRSMVGIAQTGSGKTLAYVLPAIVHINAQAPTQPREGPIALVLVPTRELCTQIAQETAKFTESVREVGGVETKIACAFGGVHKKEQIWALRESLDILIAAPGRLMDFLNSGETCLHRTTYLVLDEADQMFDMGFEPQLRAILGQIRPDRQTLMWSATWPKEVRRLAESICVDKPVHVQIGADELVANHQIHQVVSLVTNEREKIERMFSEVLPQLYVTDSGERVDDAKLLIFCNTKDTVDFITQRMREEGVSAVAIHSGKEQKERLWVFEQFRAGDTKVLVSTNLMGRGVDVPKVNIVLNYDMPKNISEYIHRIGRTGRAGAQGRAISFMSYGDGPICGDLIRVMNEAAQDVPNWLVEFQRNPYYRPVHS